MSNIPLNHSLTWFINAMDESIANNMNKIMVFYLWFGNRPYYTLHDLELVCTFFGIPLEEAKVMKKHHKEFIKQCKELIK